jgi:hypothetical protein
MALDDDDMTTPPGELDSGAHGAASVGMIVPGGQRP